MYGAELLLRRRAVEYDVHACGSTCVPWDGGEARGTQCQRGKGGCPREEEEKKKKAKKKEKKNKHHTDKYICIYMHRHSQGCRSPLSEQEFTLLGRIQPQLIL